MKSLFSRRILFCFENTLYTHQFLMYGMVACHRFRAAASKKFVTFSGKALFVQSCVLFFISAVMNVLLAVIFECWVFAPVCRSFIFFRTPKNLKLKLLIFEISYGLIEFGNIVLALLLYMGIFALLIVGKKARTQMGIVASCCLLVIGQLGVVIAYRIDYGTYMGVLCLNNSLSCLIVLPLGPVRHALTKALGKMTSSVAPTTNAVNH